MQQPQQSLCFDANNIENKKCKNILNTQYILPNYLNSLQEILKNINKMKILVFGNLWFLHMQALSICNVENAAYGKTKHIVAMKWHVEQLERVLAIACVEWK